MGGGNSEESPEFARVAPGGTLVLALENQANSLSGKCHGRQECITGA
jgi:hypothetical protein